MRTVEPGTAAHACKIECACLSRAGAALNPVAENGSLIIGPGCDPGMTSKRTHPDRRTVPWNSNSTCPFLAISRGKCTNSASAGWATANTVVPRPRLTRLIGQPVHSSDHRMTPRCARNILCPTPPSLIQQFACRLCFTQLCFCFIGNSVPLKVQLMLRRTFQGQDFHSKRAMPLAVSGSPFPAQQRLAKRRISFEFRIYLASSTCLRTPSCSQNLPIALRIFP